MEKVPPELIPIEDFITPTKCLDETKYNLLIFHILKIFYDTLTQKSLICCCPVQLVNVFELLTVYADQFTVLIIYGNIFFKLKLPNTEFVVSPKGPLRSQAVV